MEKDQPEYLSADDLRNRLYHSLRDRGLVDSIKSKLRNSLVKELQQTTRGDLSVRDLRVPDEGSLLHRASNSLVADHLRVCKYDYSLSVFLPESGTAQDKIFSAHDLLQLLHVSPQSRLYKKMASGRPDHSKKGFLWQLLCELSALHSQSVLDCGVQTDLIKVGPISSLDEKMTDVDEFYSSRRDEHFRSGTAAVEDRLLSFQRQLEERYRSDLKLEVARVKDNDIARIRMEEQEKSRREIEQQRRELERTYQTKLDSLLLKERNSIERMQKEQEIHEKEIYAQRQSILEEIEVIRKRESEVKRESEINLREKNLQEERLKAKESEIRRREQEVKRTEVEFEQKLQNQMTTFKVEQQAKYLERTQNLEVREARVKDEERRVGDEKDKMQSIKDELKDKIARVNELEAMIDEEKHKDMSSSRQIEYLNTKLRDMSDYKFLKEQNAVMKNELETLRTRLSELLQLNERERGRQEELLRELRKPTPETLMLQRDMEKLRENLRQEQTLFSAQKTQMDKRLQEEMDRNRDLLKKFEEQTLQMKEMNRELVDLRSQLSMANTALNNEVYRRPGKDEEGNRSVSFHTSRRPAMSAESADDEDDADDELCKLPGEEFKSASPRRHHDRRYDVDDVYNDIDIEYGLPPGGNRRTYTDFSEDDGTSTASGDIVAETKYRLKSLEKEAQNLEKAYQDFHYKITNPATPLPSDKSRSPYRRSQRKEYSNKSSSHSEKIPSPAASPIQRPMSSTPYQGRQSTGDVNDSLHELTAPSSSRDKPPPRFDLSNMSDEERSVDERIERPRPITVSDLEARPGSPSIVVVPGSGSSAGNSPVEQKGRPDQNQIFETPTGPPPRGKLPPLSLDDAWKTPTLDDQWKSKPDQDDIEKKKKEEEELKQWEEERKRKEEERKKREQEEWEREQRELQKLQKSGDFEDEEKLESPDDKAKDDGIDPVMQQYMAMVQQQKEREKDLAKKTTDIWSKGHKTQETPTQSEQDLSVAEEINSNNGSENEDSW